MAHICGVLVWVDETDAQLDTKQKSLARWIERYYAADRRLHHHAWYTVAAVVAAQLLIGMLTRGHIDTLLKIEISIIGGYTFFMIVATLLVRCVAQWKLTRILILSGRYGAAMRPGDYQWAALEDQLGRLGHKLGPLVLDEGTDKIIAPELVSYLQRTAMQRKVLRLPREYSAAEITHAELLSTLALAGRLKPYAHAYTTEITI